MNYQDIVNLIDFTLQGKVYGHEITPMEHQSMATAILDFAHSVEVTGQSILQGFANHDTMPSILDSSKLCYIALCSGALTTFTYFDGYDGHPITVTCSEDEIKFVVLLWNTKYWEKIEQGFRVNRNVDGGNAQGIIE